MPLEAQGQRLGDGEEIARHRWMAHQSWTSAVSSSLPPMSTNSISRFAGRFSSTDRLGFFTRPPRCTAHQTQQHLHELPFLVSCSWLLLGSESVKSATTKHFRPDDDAYDNDDYDVDDVDYDEVRVRTLDLWGQAVWVCTVWQTSRKQQFLVCSLMADS